jgi:hypothetical protein
MAASPRSATAGTTASCPPRPGTAPRADRRICIPLPGRSPAWSAAGEISRFKACRSRHPDDPRRARK